MTKDEFTIDSIRSSRIRILQSKRGYRFGLDAVLLAHFLKLRPQEEAMEVGAGNGIIPVLLSFLQQFRRITAIELQHELAALARKNLELNGIENVVVLETDLHDLEFPSNSFDLIFSNPPYRKLGHGKLNPSQQKAVARHEIRMKLEDLFACAGRFLKPEGRLSVILPDFRENDFVKLALRHRFVWRERRYVHSFADRPPAFFLATLNRVAGTFLEHPKLVVYESPGLYTAEMEKLLRE